MSIEKAILGAGKAIAGMTAGQAAAASAGASLIGGALDRRSARKATSKANELEARRIQQAMGAIIPGFQAAQDTSRYALGQGQQMRQQGMQQGLGLIGQLYGPTAQMQQQGNLAAQRALLAGLPMQRDAILGAPVDYGQLQTTQLAVDPEMLSRMLSGLSLPQGDVRYSQFNR